MLISEPVKTHTYEHVTVVTLISVCMNAIRLTGNSFNLWDLQCKFSKINNVM